MMRFTHFQDFVPTRIHCRAMEHRVRFSDRNF